MGICRCYDCQKQIPGIGSVFSLHLKCKTFLWEFTVFCDRVGVLNHSGNFDRLKNLDAITLVLPLLVKIDLSHVIRVLFSVCCHQLFRGKAEILLNQQVSAFYL